MLRLRGNLNIKDRDKNPREPTHVRPPAVAPLKAVHEPEPHVDRQRGLLSGTVDALFAAFGATDVRAIGMKDLVRRNPVPAGWAGVG